MLEHIRVLLGADHALYSECEPELGLVTNLAWTGTLDSPEVSTVGLSLGRRRIAPLPDGA